MATATRFVPGAFGAGSRTLGTVWTIAARLDTARVFVTAWWNVIPLAGVRVVAGVRAAVRFKFRSRWRAWMILPGAPGFHAFLTLCFRSSAFAGMLVAARGRLVGRGTG